MRKPESLRAHLTAALPWLQANPDRLLVFADEGGIVSTEETGLSFEWRYTLNLIFTDLALHPDEIAVPLLGWVRENQSELMGNPERRDGIRFEADVLAGDKIDLSIKLPLTERVGVHLQDGNHVVEHYAEPTWDEAFPSG
ncbi:phage tail protein [Stenotrophomonas acidaminiphila]|uniref:phage tail protein n=1 Tax=Stenotrophomonas acidaminiphila TaxID=128780 RepID=UPI0020C5E098